MGSMDDYSSQINQIIQAASQHDLQNLQEYVEAYQFDECEAVDVKDPKSGFSPLHAAIDSCNTASPNNAPSSEATDRDGIENDACEIVRYLLDNGAIWNQLDMRDETPGCIAYRLQLDSLYQLMVDAGVRAELLINRLDGYEELDDEDEHEEDSEEIPNVSSQNDTANESVKDDVDSAAYLSSTLTRNDSKLLDDKNNGVMMAWENGIMLQSADAILYETGLKVLNVGFGMGIIDSHIQNHKNRPISHHIVEAHPEVIEDMKKTGWYQKSGIVVHEGKWQDVLPELIVEGYVFDSIFFDTFAESYGQFREFFTEQVIGLLSETGKWSYFNGMGADRQISYDVYQKVVELDLFESGFDVEWMDVELPKLDQVWEGVKRKYWNVSRYRLPVCKFMS